MSALEFWHHHGAMSVPDLDASVDWYQRVLGFKLHERYPHPKVPNAEVALMKNGSMHIELFKLPDAVAASPDRRDPHGDLLTHGNKHIAFAVPNIDPVVEELRKRDADIVFARRVERGAVIFLRDNAGNLIEFVEVGSLGAELSVGRL